MQWCNLLKVLIRRLDEKIGKYTCGRLVIYICISNSLVFVSRNHLTMASSVLSQSFFTKPTPSHSSISMKSSGKAASFSVSVDQSALFSRSHVVSAHFKRPHEGFVPSCISSGDISSAAETPIELKYPAFPTVMDINQIREILPHRFPFLLVDRVIEYTPGVSVVAIKNVTINDNFFQGHFPKRPVMPGALVMEAMAQVCGLLMLQPEVGGSHDNLFFAGVDKVRFRKPVVAGDTLVMRINLVTLQKRFGFAKMEGKAYVGGEVVSEGEFLLAIGCEGGNWENDFGQTYIVESNNPQMLYF